MVKKTYKILKKSTLFSEGPIHLVNYQVRTPLGKILSRQVLEHPGCVAIIPQTASGKFVLVRQYRFPLAKYLWEFPAGGRELGESFPAAAKRELMEEIGMKPGRLQRITAFFPTPGISGEEMHLFLATRMKPAVAQKDEDEEFELGEFTLAEIGRMIRRGKIRDGKTIIGFFYLKNPQNR